MSGKNEQAEENADSNENLLNENPEPAFIEKESLSNVYDDVISDVKLNEHNSKKLKIIGVTE